MDNTALPRLLCVDDEPFILDWLSRALRRHFDVTTAIGGVAGLATLASEDPFAVVMSDLRMPGLDGVAFLREVRQRFPDTTRVLLTGYADLQATIEAVNDGNVFRFLTKPCSADVLIAALQASAEQNRLVTGEKVLLERTLHQSIKALTDVLALTNPVAFGRSMRAKTLITTLAARFGIQDKWQIEVAAMLSQVGSITLPYETLDKIYNGDTLGETEKASVDRLPIVFRQLFGDIPRLESVVDILVYQAKQFDGGGMPSDGLKGKAIPWGARALKAIVDFDTLETQGLTSALSIDAMRARRGFYDPEILEAMADVQGIQPDNSVILEISLRAIGIGMVFVDDVKTRNGRLLIARGQEASESLVERIKNLPRDVDVNGPIRVVVHRDLNAGRRTLNSSHAR